MIFQKYFVQFVLVTFSKFWKAEELELIEIKEILTSNLLFNSHFFRFWETHLNTFQGFQ